MKTFLRVVFIIAFVSLSVNLLRLTYRIYLEPTSSVLDKYDKPAETEIKQAESLQALVDSYEEAREKVEAYESDTTNPEVEYLDRDHTDPYESEHRFKAAIHDWEQKSRHISKLRTYWFFGLLFLVLGSVAYRRFSPWLGVSSLLVGFSEMIYWTSPTYFPSRTLEFERLLFNKLSLGLVTFVLLILAGFLTRILERRQEREEVAG